MNQHRDYLSLERYSQNYEFELQRIRHMIYTQLKDYPNFDGIDFTDVSGGYICVRGHHKDLQGYTYGQFPHLEYDFNNANEVVDNFVDMWKKCDNEEYLKEYKKFLEDGEKWGFD